jgi:hypothetical protein
MPWTNFTKLEINRKKRKTLQGRSFYYYGSTAAIICKDLNILKYIGCIGFIKDMDTSGYGLLA